MPATGVVPCFKVKVAAVIVKGSIASVKMALILLLMATPVSVLWGKMELTVGMVVSAATPVVKVHTKLLARALPDTSLAPVVTVAV